MKPIDRLVLGGVVVGLLVNVASSAFSNRYPKAGLYALIGTAVVVAAWGFFWVITTAVQYLLFGRYAVLIYFLNSKNELLLVNHPFHNRLLPPGGRLKLWELPHNAVANTLKRETGLTNFRFHPTFHNSNLMITEKVEDVPRPWWVHMEHRWQRSLVKFHYVFVYVCQFLTLDESLPHVEGYEPRWMSLPEVEALGKERRPFDDIILRYKQILARIAPAQTPSAVGTEQ